jgi:hypothetical protein
MGHRARRVTSGLPAPQDDTSTGNGTEERGVTGGETAVTQANTRATLAEARLSDFKSMLDDTREQRDRWQQQAERLAALAITDQRKEPSPAQPQSWRRMFPAPTGTSCFYGSWASSVGAFCFPLFVNRLRTRLRVTADPDDCSATVTSEVDGGRGPIHPPSVPLDLGESPGPSGDSPWVLHALTRVRAFSRPASS